MGGARQVEGRARDADGGRVERGVIETRARERLGLQDERDVGAGDGAGRGGREDHVAGGAGGDGGGGVGDGQDTRGRAGGRDGEVILEGRVADDGVADREVGGGADADVTEDAGRRDVGQGVIVDRAGDGDGARGEVTVDEAGGGRLGGQGQVDAVGQEARGGGGHDDVGGLAGDDVGARVGQREEAVAAGGDDAEGILVGRVGAEEDVADGQVADGVRADVAEGDAGVVGGDGEVIGHAGDVDRAAGGFGGQAFDVDAGHLGGGGEAEVDAAVEDARAGGAERDILRLAREQVGRIGRGEEAGTGRGHDGEVILEGEVAGGAQGVGQREVARGVRTDVAEAEGGAVGRVRQVVGVAGRGDRRRGERGVGVTFDAGGLEGDGAGRGVGARGGGQEGNRDVAGGAARDVGEAGEGRAGDRPLQDFGVAVAGGGVGDRDASVQGGAAADITEGQGRGRRGGGSEAEELDPDLVVGDLAGGADRAFEVVHGQHRVREGRGGGGSRRDERTTGRRGDEGAAVEGVAVGEVGRDHVDVLAVVNDLAGGGGGLGRVDRVDRDIRVGRATDGEGPRHGAGRRVETVDRGRGGEHAADEGVTVGDIGRGHVDSGIGAVRVTDLATQVGGDRGVDVFHRAEGRHAGHLSVAGDRVAGDRAGLDVGDLGVQFVVARAELGGVDRGEAAREGEAVLRGGPRAEDQVGAGAVGTVGRRVGGRLEHQGGRATEREGAVDEGTVAATRRDERARRAELDLDVAVELEQAVDGVGADGITRGPGAGDDQFLGRVELDGARTLERLVRADGEVAREVREVEGRTGAAGGADGDGAAGDSATVPDDEVTGDGDVAREGVVQGEGRTGRDARGAGVVGGVGQAAAPQDERVGQRQVVHVEQAGLEDQRAGTGAVEAGDLDLAVAEDGAAGVGIGAREGQLVDAVVRGGRVGEVIGEAVLDDRAGTGDAGGEVRALDEVAVALEGDGTGADDLDGAVDVERAGRAAVAELEDAAGDEGLARVGVVGRQDEGARAGLSEAGDRAVGEDAGVDDRGQGVGGVHADRGGGAEGQAGDGAGVGADREDLGQGVIGGAADGEVEARAVGDGDRAREGRVVGLGEVQGAARDRRRAGVGEAGGREGLRASAGLHQGEGAGDRAAEGGVGGAVQRQRLGRAGVGHHPTLPDQAVGQRTDGGVITVQVEGRTRLDRDRVHVRAEGRGRTDEHRAGEDVDAAAEGVVAGHRDDAHAGLAQRAGARDVGGDEDGVGGVDLEGRGRERARAGVDDLAGEDLDDVGDRVAVEVEHAAEDLDDASAEAGLVLGHQRAGIEEDAVREGIGAGEDQGARAGLGEDARARQDAGELDAAGRDGGGDGGIEGDRRRDDVGAGGAGDGGGARVGLEGQRTARARGDRVAAVRGIEGDRLEARRGAVERDRGGRAGGEDGVVEGRGVDIGEGRVETRGALVGTPVGAEAAGEGTPRAVAVGVPDRLAGVDEAGRGHGGGGQRLGVEAGDGVRGGQRDADVTGERAGGRRVDGDREVLGRTGGEVGDGGGGQAGQRGGTDGRQAVLAVGGGDDGVLDRDRAGDRGGADVEDAEAQGRGVDHGVGVIVGRAGDGEALRRQGEVGQAGAGQRLGGQGEVDGAGERTRDGGGHAHVAGGGGGDVRRVDEGEAGVGRGRGDGQLVLVGRVTVGGQGVGHGQVGGRADADVAEGQGGRGQVGAGEVVGGAGDSQGLGREGGAGQAGHAVGVRG